VRWNAAFAFLDPVRHQPNLTVAGTALVDRVIIEHGRAVGVSVLSGNETSTVRADRVVLCAGSFGSPAILLRSGIGPARESLGLGLEVAADLPGVGRNLLDHPCICVRFAGTEEFVSSVGSTPWHPDEQALGRAKSPFCDTGPYDIHVYLSAGILASGERCVALCGGAMLARSQGTLRLRNADPRALPCINPAYLSDPEHLDRRVLEHAGQLIGALSRDPGFARLLGEEIGAQRDPQDALISYCHPSGSCKMGPENDPGAVVDADGRVYGVHRLYVADASIMPTNVRGNINLPTAMIAARVVEKLTAGSSLTRDAAGAAASRLSSCE
jgi:choline dehydrogenase